MLGAILCDIEVGFVDASALESRVVVGEDVSNFVGFCCIFLEIGTD
jgi:hypothetical protein